jgi:hypothetical protein
MRSFIEFLCENDRVLEHNRPYFHRWVMIYIFHSGAENIDSRSMSEAIPASKKTEVRQDNDHTSQAAPESRSVRESRHAVPQWDRIDETVSRFIRLKHLSSMTEKSYLGWIRRFRHHVRGKSCADLTEHDVKGFLSFSLLNKKLPLQRKR